MSKHVKIKAGLGVQTIFATKLPAVKMILQNKPHGPTIGTFSLEMNRVLTIVGQKDLTWRKKAQIKSNDMKYSMN
jgi:hypothetical protein